MGTQPVAGRKGRGAWAWWSKAILLLCAVGLVFAPGAGEPRAAGAWTDQAAAALATSQAVTLVWDLQQAVQGVDLLQPTLRLDGAGSPHLVYSKGATSSSIEYARRQETGWVRETAVSSGFVSRGGFVLDGQVVPHVVYSGGYSRRQNGQWVAGPAAPSGFDLKLALRSGVPQVCYYLGNGTLKYASLEGDTWNSQDVGTELSFTCAIAADSSAVHIVYRPTSQQLKYARWDGTNWTYQTVDGAKVAGIGGIALDPQGRPHIVYIGQDSQSQAFLRYAYWDGAQWQLEVIDPLPGGPFYAPDVAVDSQGRAHVAYSDAQWNVAGSVYYGLRDGGQWQKQRVAGVTPSDYQDGVSLAVDGDNLPHIAWYDHTSGNRGLSYARLVQQKSADLEVTKVRQGTGSVTAGNTVSFTVTVTNKGPDAPVNARLTDTVNPAGAVQSITATSEALSDSCAVTGTTVTCDLVNVPLTPVRRVTVQVTTAAGFSGTLSNSATVQVTGNATDPVSTNNAAGPVEVPVVAPTPDLVVDKTGPATVEPGQTFDYTVTWSNAGSLAAAATVLTDTLPTGVAFVSAEGNPTYDAQARRLTWTLGTAAPNATATYQVRVTANTGLADNTALQNTVQITTTTPNDPQANNSKTVSTTVFKRVANLEAAMDFSPLAPATIYVGDEITYTIALMNSGNLDLDPQVNAPIPTGTSYVAGSATATVGTVGYAGGGITWSGTLESFGSQGVTIRFRVKVVACNGEQCGLIVNRAQITVPGYQYLNRTLTVQTKVYCPDLTISVEGDSVPVQFDASTLLTFTAGLVYENRDNHFNPRGVRSARVRVSVSEGAPILETTRNPTRKISDRTWEWDLAADEVDGTRQWIYLNLGAQAFRTAGYTVTAEITGDPVDECTDGQPNQNQWTAYPFTMEIEPQVDVQNVSWRPNNLLATSLPGGTYRIEALVKYRYRNAHPFRQPISEYTLTVKLPASWPHLGDSAMSSRRGTFHAHAPTSLHWHFNELQVDDGGWVRFAVVANDGRVKPGDLFAPELHAVVALNGLADVLEMTVPSDLASVGVPLFPPIITFPQSGELCAFSLDNFERTVFAIKGLAPRGVKVAIYTQEPSDQSPPFWTIPDAKAVVNDLDGSFTTERNKLLLRPARMRAVTYLGDEPWTAQQNGLISALSLEILLTPRADALWNPAQSFWRGEVKAGPLEGQVLTFSFRDENGKLSADDFSIPGLYGFWDTELWLYTCGCRDRDATLKATVIADFIEYTPAEQSGNFLVFRIAYAHSVRIKLECVLPSGGTCSTNSVREAPDQAPAQTLYQAWREGEAQAGIQLQAQVVVCQSQTSSGQVLIDPDGFIFDATRGWGNVVPGSTATAMWWNEATLQWVIWPAHLYENQVNPQVTGASGYFAFFTPPGFYYIDVRGPDGFQLWRSPVVQVISEIVHVNVPYTPAVSAAATASIRVSPNGLKDAVGQDASRIAVPAGGVVEWVSDPPTDATAQQIAALTATPVVRVRSALDVMTDTKGWDSGMLAPGASYRRTFTQAGTFPYSTGTGHAGTVVVYSGTQAPTLTDSDSDGVLDREEQGPDGSNAAYDGNNDGTPDRLQNTVISRKNCGGGYVTLATAAGRFGGGGSVPLPSTRGAPAGLAFRWCFYEFRLEGLTNGGHAMVTVYLPAGANPSRYYKYGATAANALPHWYEFPAATHPTPGAEITGNQVVLHLTDGALGDDDLTADGVIVDAGGPGQAGNFTLAVQKVGTGAGKVTSSGTAGVDCGLDCAEEYGQSTAVTLAATPNAGSIFAGWAEGGCSGTGSCTVTLTANTTVVATFNLVPAPPPSSGGGGGGAVVGPPPGPPSTMGSVNSAAGGSVSVDGITVVVPPGTTAQATTLTVRVTVAQVPAGARPPAGSLPGSRVFTIDLSSAGGTVTRLDQGLELAVPYRDADLRLAGGDPSRLRLHRYDEAKGTWQELPTTADPAAQTLRATTTQTSLFALMALLPMPTGLQGPAGGVVYGLGTTLAWTNPPDVAQYQVQVVPVNSDGPAINLIIGRLDLVQAARFPVAAPVLGQGNYVLLPGMGYTWRVRTSPLTTLLKEGDPRWSAWAEGGAFRTSPPTSGTITAVRPMPGGTAAGGTPTLQWANANPSIFYYEVQLSKDPAFEVDPARATAAVYWNLVHGGVSSPVNSWTVPAGYALEKGGTYYWRVRPRVQGDGTPVAWSETWSFVRTE